MPYCNPPFLGLLWSLQASLRAEVIVYVLYEILPNGKFIDLIPQLNISVELYLEATL